MEQVLPLLIESAAAERDRRAAGLRHAQLAVNQADDTLQRLGQFRVECLARSAAGRLGGGDAQSLANYQRFVARLDEAIAMQRQQRALCQANADAAQQVLLHWQQRLLAFQTLARRRAAEREALAMRRGQRESDEFAARSFARGLPPLP